MLRLITSNVSRFVDTQTATYLWLHSVLGFVCKLDHSRAAAGSMGGLVVEQHQYVTRVEDGGQAVIGPKVRTRGGVRNGGGR